MDIAEVKKRRDSLEAAIRNQLQMFEDETGVSVTSLDIRRLPMMGSISGHVAQVSMHLRIA